MSGSNTVPFKLSSLDQTEDEREEGLDEQPSAELLSSPDSEESESVIGSMQGNASSSGNRMKIALLSFAGLFVLIVVGFGFYLFSPGDRSPWRTLTDDSVAESESARQTQDRPDATAREQSPSVAATKVGGGGDTIAPSASPGEKIGKSINEAERLSQASPAGIVQAAAAAGIDEAFALGQNNTATVLHAAEIAYQKAIDAGATHEEAKAAANAAVQAILAQNPMSDIETNAIQAHIETSLGNSGQNSQESLSYLAQSVAGAVEAAGGSSQEQLAFAENAIDVKSGYIGASGNDVSTVLANMRENLGDTTQPVAVGSDIGTDTIDGISALEFNAQPGTSTREEPGAAGEKERFVELAAQEADRLGLSGKEREDFIVQKAAELSAHERGLSALEVELAGVTALANHHAMERGASANEARRIADQAALEYMDAKGVPPEIQDAILYRIDMTPWTDTVKAMAASEMESTGIGESYGSTVSASTGTEGAVETRISLLENRLDNLVSQVSETNRLIVRLSQKQEQNQREVDSRMDGFVERLNGFEGAIRRVANNSLDGIKGAVDKLQANFGWVSNRLCEEEARSGAFNNENACKAIYDRIRNEAPKASKVVASTAAVATTVAPKAAAESETEASDRPIVRRYGVIPATKGFVKPNLSATTPGLADESVKEVEPVKEINLCESAISHFKATHITENSAVIQNRWGATRKVQHNSFIDGLGAVKAFGADVAEPYVEFSNAVVCG